MAHPRAPTELPGYVRGQVQAGEGKQRDQGGSEMVAEPSRGDPSRTRQRVPGPGLEAPSSGLGCLLAQWAEGS